MKIYLFLPRIRVHNANAASSLYTIGFPAMTSWLGAMHALERRIHESAFPTVHLRSLGIACHTFDLQTYQGPGAYQPAIVGTSNPLKRSKKTGEYERPPFIQEPRAHLEVSLLIEVTGVNVNEKAALQEEVTKILPRMKLAGGDIQNTEKDLRIRCLLVDEQDPQDIRETMRSLMPGYILIERRSRLFHYMKEKGEKDALTALLDHLVIDVESEQDEQGTGKSWKRTKKIAGGWIVPIAVGFHDLSGRTQGACYRDAETEHHFVEPIVTLGEFVLPIRVEHIEDMMWSYGYDAEKGYYLCRNEKV